MRDFNFISHCKMGGLSVDVAEKYASRLTEDTKNRLAKKGFRMDLIAPVLEHADALCKENKSDFDYEVNCCLDNQNFICGLIAKLK